MDNIVREGFSKQELADLQDLADQLQDPKDILCNFCRETVPVYVMGLTHPPVRQEKGSRGTNCRWYTCSGCYLNRLHGQRIPGNKKLKTATNRCVSGCNRPLNYQEWQDVRSSKPKSTR